MTDVTCPNCGQKTKFEGNKFRPFCSEKCKQRDLGHWAMEKYKIPEEEPGASVGPGKKKTEE